MYPHEYPGALWYDQEEVDAVSKVISNKSPFRYYGVKCDKEVFNFEKELGEYLSTSSLSNKNQNNKVYVTAVNSGTGALEIALDVLGVGSGDEVIVPGFMWISSISAIIRSRAIPVLVDSDQTLGVDPEDLKVRISERTKVIMVVPMLGGSSKIGEIMEVVRNVNNSRKKKNLSKIFVLEDCAQSLGAHAFGIPGSSQASLPEGCYKLGTFGDIGTFSLQLNKDITAGEGGMVVTRDKELNDRVDALHNAGYIKKEKNNINWYGDIPYGWGHGRRMSELQGAVARVQLKKLDTILDSIRKNHSFFEEFFKKQGIKLRKRAYQNNPGDTGYYLCFHLPENLDDNTAISKGREIAKDLKDKGFNVWFLHDFEVHIYYNIEPLVKKFPMNDGSPWEDPKNSFHTQYKYDHGALPNLDHLLIRTIGLNMPSKMSDNTRDNMMNDLLVTLKNLY